MKKLKLIIEKILIFVLMILPLTISFINPLKTIAAEAMPIDLGTYNEATVNAPIHTHIWTTKFDDNYHWEECSICKNTRNKTTHVLSGNGGSKTLCENGYFNEAYRETCNCGFQSKPQVVVHGRYENYVDCQTLNYGTMNNQTFNNLKHVSNAEFQDLLNGTNNSGKNPSLQKLPATPGGQPYTWNAIDNDGLGLIFMGGPIMSDTRGVKGTLELIIGSEGDCGKKVAFDEYFILTRYIYSTENPTRLGFVSYMENNTPHSDLINNSDHMLYGYPAKYRNRVNDTQWNKIVAEFKGYYTHTSSWGWQSMNIQHAGHANSGSYIYATSACYDSSNHHSINLNDDVPINCDICDCHYNGNEGYSSDTWYRCSAHERLNDGESVTCGGHIVTGKDGVKLGTVYCNFKRTGDTTVRTNVTVVPEKGFTVVENTTVPNTVVPKLDSTNPSSTWTYYGIVRLSNQKSGSQLISRGINCGINYGFNDTIAPTAYGYSNNTTNNSYWKVEGAGTQSNPKTQSKITVTFKDPQQYSRNVVKVKVYDSDQKTVLPQGNNVTETPLTKVSGTSGDNTLWQGTINIMTEVNGTKNIYVQAIDACNRTSALIPMQISYIDAQGPTLTITADKNNNTWATSKILTLTGSDDYKYYSMGTSATDMIQVGNTTYNNQRKYEVTGDTYSQPRTIRFYAQDTAGNLSYKDYSISHIDNTKPTIDLARVTIGHGSSTMQIVANDKNRILNEEGSGVTQYAASKDLATLESKFQTSNQFTLDETGRYYFAVKDAVGNISVVESTIINIMYDLTINPNGGVYNNSNNSTIKAIQDGTTESIAIPTRVGYNFAGWTLTGTNSTLTYTDNSLTKPATFKMGTEDATLTANWTPRNDTDYVVRHWKQNLYDNTNEETKEYYNTQYDDIIYELTDAEELQGTSDTKVTPAVKIYEGFTSPERQEITINADGSGFLDYYYKRNEYNVKLNGDNGIDELIGERKYLYADTVRIGANVKPGYTWKEWDGDVVSGEEQYYTFTMPSNNVEETASTSIVEYTISYNSNDADPTTAKAVMPENPETYNIETEEFILRNPTRDGYEFVGWTIVNDEIIVDLEEGEIVEPKVDVTIVPGTHGNLTFTANWNKNEDTKYTVKHWQQRIYKDDDETKEKSNASIYNEENYKLVDTEEFAGVTDDTIVPETKEYEGFTAPIKQELVIKGDGTSELNYYYTRNYYKLKIEKDENIANTEGEGTYLYGEKVKVNCTSSYGYSFKEWQGDKENMHQEDYVTMPANDKEIKAISMKNKHQVKINLDEEDIILDVEYDDTIVIDKPEKNGYEFLYFETEDGKKVYENKLYIDDKDYVIKPVWGKIPEMNLPQTGENDTALLAIYTIITIASFALAIELARKNSTSKIDK